MAIRKIVNIDRALCTGCGLCITACDEGALTLDEEGKATLIREIYCDGMGVCLDVCPCGALTITERESKKYDVEATQQHVLETRGAEAVTAVHAEPHLAGNSTAASHVDFSSTANSPACQAPISSESPENSASELSQWPIQLKLINPQAPYFQEVNLLIAADCTAFALGNFHQQLLKGHKLVIACPKLDDTRGYLEKLTELFSFNKPKSIIVAIMSVSCCKGLQQLVEKAVEDANISVNIHQVLCAV